MRKFVVASTVAAVLVAGAAAFAAAAPSQDGVIAGCVKRDGNLRLIIAGDAVLKDTTCKKDETAVLWNQIGPTGPQGPTGPAGPAGVTIFANVRADGTLANGGGVVGAAKFDPLVFGSGYVVTFGRTVAACAAVASPGQTGVGSAQSDAVASSNVDTLGSDKVYVQFKSTAGAFVDTDFHLILACP